METAAERRDKIKSLLIQTAGPITGTDLATRAGVSRQVIVQDIAVLRAEGVDIQAGPQGYRVLQPEQQGNRIVVAVSHDPGDTEEELNLMVDAGVEILDVVVEHEVYGEIRGSLHIAGRNDVKRFMTKIREGHSGLLSELTDGVHLHTLTARDPERLKEAVEALKDRGFLIE